MHKKDFICIIGFLAITCFSCSKNEQLSGNKSLFSIDNKPSITSSLNVAIVPAVHLYTEAKTLPVLSPALQKMGITRMDQLYRNINEVSYKYTGKLTGTITYTQIDTSKIRLTLVNYTTTTLVLNKKTALYNNSIDLFTSSVQPGLSEQTNLAALVYLFDDLAEGPGTATAFLVTPVITRPEGGPGFCTDYTAISMRITRSRAEWYLNDFVTRYINANPGCARLFGVDSGCLWESYGCVATQSIQCCSPL